MIDEYKDETLSKPETQRQPQNLEDEPTGVATSVEASFVQQEQEEEEEDVKGKNEPRGARRMSRRRRRRLRSSSPTAAAAATTLAPSWESFRNQTHSLRISASDTAACVGFHPYKSLVKLAMDHVYQESRGGGGGGGQELLRHDAKLLGIELVSEEEILLQIAKQAGASTHKALQSALRVKTGQNKVDTVEQANNVKDTVVKEALRSKKLTPTQIQQLQEGARHSVNTGFGKSWEDTALDMYEKQCGWEVRDRNAEIRIWPFAAAETKVGNIATVEAKQPAYAYRRRLWEPSVVRPASPKAKRPRSEKQKEDQSASVVDLVGEGSEETEESTGRTDASDDASSSSSRRNNNSVGDDDGPYFFSMRGSVDGIRDELVPTSTTNNVRKDDDDDSWILTPIIVECKHRMNRIQPNPPLYEMIQATAYCLMYQVDSADLVQVLRQKVEPKAKPEAVINKENQKNNNHGDEVNNTNDNHKITHHFPVESKQRDNGTTENSAATPIGDNPNIPESQEQSDSGSGKENEADSDSRDDLNPNSDKSRVNGADDSQAVEKEGSPSMEGNGVAQNEDGSSGGFQIAVNRISLEDPLHHHRHNWETVVLPRLRSWVDAIYAIRSNDDKRYQLLMATASEQLDVAWKILFRECPWLEHCDTSYSREVNP